MNRDNNHGFLNPFTLNFDLVSGLAKSINSTKRKLSNMRNMFFNTAILDEMLAAGDEMVYEFYELGLPDDAGDVAFGTSIVNPGKVGNEYYMTKGHFHNVLETSEVYFCLSGKGIMLMETPEGEWDVQEMNPGTAVYCPKRYAHRSINVGKEPLVTFFAFRADAGHDYGSIESTGFRKLVVECDGKPEIIDNPKWRREDVKF